MSQRGNRLFFWGPAEVMMSQRGNRLFFWGPAEVMYLEGFLVG